MIRLRRKVMPRIHDASFGESAKEDMLARSLEDRFSISTANYFNVSTDWDFEAKGNASIEATKQWYKETDLPQLRQMMEEHKEKTRQGVFNQLSSFRSEWSTYKGIKGDLHISISNNNEPVPEAHNLFHVKLNSNLDVQISLTNPALGYLSIPVMNVFSACWKVSPEDIWNAALQNEITDSRGSTSATKHDAFAAKDKALSQIKKASTPQQPFQTKMVASPPQRQSVSTSTKSDAPVTNPNAKRIMELEESIAALQKEAESISGLFGFVKRNKIKKEIDAQQRELESLKRKR